MFCHWEPLWCHFIWHMEHATRANCVKIPKFYKESRVSSARHPWEHCVGTKRAHKPFLKGPILASLLNQLMWHTQANDNKLTDSFLWKELDRPKPGKITVTHSPVMRKHVSGSIAEFLSWKCDSWTKQGIWKRLLFSIIFCIFFIDNPEHHH